MTLGWLAPAGVLAAAGCGQLVEDSFWFESVTIEAPADGAVILGHQTFPVEISVECDHVEFVEVRFGDWPAGVWTSDRPQAPGCSGRPHTYCVAADVATPLGLGSFWPASMHAMLSCANRAGDFDSGTQSVFVAPFEAVAWPPASVRSLFGAPGGGVIAVSASGVHRIDPRGKVAGLANPSPAARAFLIGRDVYYYAPCTQLACDAAAPDLFRVDATTLAPGGASTRLGCAPAAMIGLGEQRVIALGECDAPGVLWAAADLASQLDEPLDVRFTDQAARRGDEAVVLAWRGDELVIVVAGDAPPLAVRPTGVHGTLAALSDDGARAAVVDAAGRLVHIDTTTGAIIASAALAPEAAVAIAYAPGSHRAVVAFAGAWWLVDDTAAGVARRGVAPVDDDDTPLTVLAAAPLDGRRTLVIADPPQSAPPRRLLSVTDGATAALRVWVGGDWQLTAPPLLGADGTLYLAFDTLQGAVVVWHQIGPP